MSVKRRKFVLGVRSKPTNIPTADNGDISVSSVDNKLKITTYTYSEYAPATAYVVGDKVRYSPENKNYVCIQNSTGNLPTDVSFWQVYEQSVVTEDQIQTLTNKTIDATAATGTNSLSADSVDIVYDDTIETVISLQNDEDPSAPVENVQEAIDSIKRALDAQNEASEIEFAPTDDISSNKVQGAIEDVQDNLKAHLDDTSAHDSDSIDYTPTTPANWNTDPTKVNGALDELSGRLETSEGDLSTAKDKIDDLVTLSGVAANSEDLGTFPGTIIPDNSTVKGALESLETQTTTTANSLGSHIAATSAHGAMGEVVGTLNPQTIRFKIIQGALYREMQYELAEDNPQTGSDVVLTEPTQPIVRLSSGLNSVAGIAQVSYAANKVLTIFNPSFSSEIEIRNKSTIAAIEERIVTGTDDDITLAPEAALFLKYDSISQVWRVIGGTGGSSTVVKGIAGEAISGGFFTSLGTDGKVYRLNASDDNRIEYIGITKDFALENQNIKSITSGIVKGFVGLTPGLPLYASPISPGEYTQTDPENSIFNNKWVIRLGIAISATEMLLNPDQAASAYFKSEVQADVPILNNQSTPQNLNNLAFDGTTQNRVTLEYGLFRRTDTDSLAQAGELKLVYNDESLEWFLSDTYAGQNAGVSFSITSGGQLQYTSTDLAGANYSGRLEYRIAISTGLAETSLLVDDGDLITKVSGVSQRLPIGPVGSTLTSNGTTPEWQSEIYVFANGSTGANITNAENTVIINNEVEDTHNAYNPATGVFTAPRNTICNFQWRVGSQVASFTALNAFYSLLVKNGSTICSSNLIRVQSGSTSYATNGSCTLRVSEGETYEVKALSTTTVAAATNSGGVHLTISCK